MASSGQIRYDSLEVISISLLLLMIIIDITCVIYIFKPIYRFKKISTYQTYLW